MQSRIRESAVRARPRPRRLAALGAALLACSLGTTVRALDKVILGVVVNTENKGDHFAYLSDDGDILVTPSTFQDLGLRPAEKTLDVAGEAYVSLASFGSRLRYDLDRRELRLRIDADPQLFAGRSLDLGRTAPPGLVKVQSDAAFFNYNATYRAGPGLSLNSLSLTGEGAATVGGVAGLTSIAYVHTDAEDRFVRLQSSLTRDLERSMIRLVLGDLVSNSGQAEGRVSMAGFGVSRNFTIEPYFLPNPGFDVSGVVQTPSEVDVYLGGQLLRREAVSPGLLSIRNLPVATGAGDATVVIRDAYGREQTLSETYYFSPRLLRPGLQEFSYNIGAQRQELGRASFRYDKLALAAFHRMGLNQWLSGGLRVENDGDAWNAGPTLAVAVPYLGEAQVMAELSSRDGLQGTQIRTVFGRVSRGLLTPNLRLTYRSRDFRNAFEISTRRIRLEARAGLTLALRRAGTLSASYLYREPYDAVTDEQYSLAYNLRLLGLLNLFASGVRVQGSTERDTVVVGLTLPLGRRRSATVTGTDDSGRKVLTSSFQRSAPLGQGLGYRVSTQTTDLTDAAVRRSQGFSEIRYRGRTGVWVASANAAQDRDSSYAFSAAGSLSWLAGGLHLARPILDSFALVSTGEAAGLRVRVNNQEVGTTSSNGRLLVPELTSYVANRLSLDTQDLSLDMQVRDVVRTVRTGYRGSGVVEFEAERVRAFEGRLRFVVEGRKIPAKFAILELETPDGKVESPLGTGGEFYLEDLKAGRYPARLFDGRRECRFELSVPEHREGLAELGDIDCAAP